VLWLTRATFIRLAKDVKCESWRDRKEEITAGSSMDELAYGNVSLMGETTYDSSSSRVPKHRSEKMNSCSSCAMPKQISALQRLQQHESINARKESIEVSFLVLSEIA
jgi:hypothetical protein